MILPSKQETYIMCIFIYILYTLYKTGLYLFQNEIDNIFLFLDSLSLATLAYGRFFYKCNQINSNQSGRVKFHSVGPAGKSTPHFGIKPRC